MRGSAPHLAGRAGAQKLVVVHTTTAQCFFRVIFSRAAEHAGTADVIPFPDAGADGPQG